MIAAAANAVHQSFAKWVEHLRAQTADFFDSLASPRELSGRVLGSQSMRSVRSKSGWVGCAKPLKDFYF